MILQIAALDRGDDHLPVGGGAHRAERAGRSRRGVRPYSAPQVTSGGTALTSTIIRSGRDDLIYTLAFDPDAAPVSADRIRVTGEADLYLMSLAYTMPDINMPILPEAPGLYALKAVTMIEAGQVDGNGHVSSYQPVTDGDPVIEFAYLQCASGPGMATIDAPAVSGGFTDPLPSRQPPYSPTSPTPRHDAPPASNFPEGDGSTTWPPTRSGPFPPTAMRPPTTGTTSTSNSTRRTSTPCTRRS